MKQNNSKLLFVLLFILGLFMMLQLQSVQSKYKYTSIQDYKKLYEERDQMEYEIEALEEQIKDLSSKISVYENEDVDLAKIVKDEIEANKEFANLTEVRGPGVVVIVNDAERELNIGENPNNLLVHDIDIQALVQDLKAAGAEAISINGERYVFGISEIQCTGPTIQINDKVYAQPFIIKAVGDRKYLKSAINAPGNYGETLRNYGIFVEVHTSVSIDVPSYKGTTTFEYIES